MEEYDGEAPGEEVLEYDEEILSTDDLAESNQILLSALIDILIRKGVLTQEELDREVEDIQEEMEDIQEDEMEDIQEEVGGEE